MHETCYLKSKNFHNENFNNITLILLKFIGNNNRTNLIYSFILFALEYTMCNMYV